MIKNLQFTIYNLQSKEKQKGQVVVILLLVIVVGLAVGLTVVGRSITEISTSTKTEESSRAFSAAEAGIEKILQQNPPLGDTNSMPDIVFSNQSKAQQIEWNANLPKSKTALEYPPFGKESFAQFWLANPSDLKEAYYDQDSFNVYFGDSKPNSDGNYYTTHPDDKPAIEAHVIYSSGGVYKSKRFFVDSSTARNNDFPPCPNLSPTPITTNDSDVPRSFYCKVTISSFKDNSSDIPIMVRIRILYSNISHPVALEPVNNSSLPPQTSIYTSVGSSGNIQRKLQVFRQKSVMPQFFSFVLFSAGDLSK